MAITGTGSAQTVAIPQVPGIVANRSVRVSVTLNGVIQPEQVQIMVYQGAAALGTAALITAAGLLASGLVVQETSVTITDTGGGTYRLAFATTYAEATFTADGTAHARVAVFEQSTVPAGADAPSAQLDLGLIT